MRSVPSIYISWRAPALVSSRSRAQIRHVLIERDILTATKTPWLVRLLYAFQDPSFVYLAMEYVPGGDFRTLLNNSGVLKEEHARFYISEMFAANQGLGFAIVQFQRTFAIPEMWSGTILLGLLGFVLAMLFRLIERRTLFWYHGMRAAARDN